MFTLTARKVALNCLAFSPGGAALAAAGAKSEVQVWDLAGRRLALARAIGWDNDAVSFEGGGRRLLVLNNHVLYHLDALTGESLGVRPAAGENVRACAVSADQRQACLYQDAASGWRHFRLPGFAAGWVMPALPPAPTAAAFSLDGRRVGVGRGSGLVRVLDAHTGEVVGDCGEEGQPEPRCVALSPDGGAVAWCAAASLHLWRVGPCQEVSRHRLSKAHFHSAAFHPSGGFFASANGDGKVDYWDARTGERLGSFDWGVGKVNDVAFDRTGERAACCSQAGAIVVWDVDR
jgi:WD40 repeat protein